MVPSKITERVKLDIHMLRLRNAIDPTQHYKKFDAKDLSKTFQVTKMVYKIFYVGWNYYR